ncbi:3-phosphoshikimate 1-carboxyvinyltransferase [Enteractinococcus coprophilus]|uniref:3-phosphoshikimate 1-carboxyvinyltransferase n=1 Tax=Enteractinococcus coprophilus TaxID=1027633 RepID=A0A542ZZW3_9MICC|nr:3-phosphoshikimate 1-carboxyvinyltransferase [Enteractinococcus coprophilus]
MVTRTPAPGETWSAPFTNTPIHATVALPGSKSLTNRHLVLAALSESPSRLTGVLVSRDTDLMIQALTALGAAFQRVNDDPTVLDVTPIRLAETTGEITVDSGLAGTVMRFIPGVAAGTQATVLVDGDEQSYARPMGPVIDGLIQAGAHISANGQDPITTLPLTVHGKGPVPGGAVGIDSGGSSQFVSALLLVGATFGRGLDLRHTGEHTPSPEHIAMTVNVLEAAGVRIEHPEPNRWMVHPGPITATDTAVEPDLSNAGPYLAAAVVTGGSVTVPYWPQETTQIGDRWRDILPAFGATVTFEPVAGTNYGDLTVTGTRDATGRPIITGGGEIADLAELTPTTAALALLADGPTRLTKIGHLRGHETDRLTALNAEATKLGATIEEGLDYLAFAGGYDLTGATLESYADHRMATFGAIIGLAVEHTVVHDIATTAKTMPDFPSAWTKLAAGQRDIRA